jgi:hypothetical protein
VEKPVDNVENYEFSTGILLFSPSAPPCGKPFGSGLHNTISGCPENVLRHRPAEGSFRKKRKKKLGTCEKMLSKIVCARNPTGYFCEKQTKIILVSTSVHWKYFSYHHKPGGTPCREK